MLILAADGAGGQAAKRKLVIESDSDDDVPLAMRQSALAAKVTAE